MITILKKDKDGILSVDEKRIITLKLFTETYARNLGWFSKNGETLNYYKNAKEIHTFRTLNAWGINYVILEALSPESMINIRTEQSIYRIQAKRALEVGQYYHFNKPGKGIELQFFVPKESFLTETI